MRCEMVQAELSTTGWSAVYRRPFNLIALGMRIGINWSCSQGLPHKMCLADPRLRGRRDNDSNFVLLSTQGLHEGENVRRASVVRGPIVINHLANLESPFDSAVLEADSPEYACSLLVVRLNSRSWLFLPYFLRRRSWYKCRKRLLEGSCSL